MRMIKKIFICLLFVLVCASCFEEEKQINYDGADVLLVSSNLRGDVNKLNNILGYKEHVESLGAKVTLVDAGNFLQGSIYTTYDSGKTFVSFMGQVGYDACVVGMYDFAFGSGVVGTAQHEIYYSDGSVFKFLEDANIAPLSANLTVFETNKVINNFNIIGLSDGAKVLSVVENADENVKVYDDASTLNNIKDAISKNHINALVSNMSTYSFVNGLDLKLYTDRFDFYLRESVIEKDGRISNNVITNYEAYTSNLKTSIDDFINLVNQAQPSTIVYKNNVDLVGSQIDVRSKETTLGNLFTDAMRDYAINSVLTCSGANYELKVDPSHLVACFNGGNLRSSLFAGDVTMKDLQRVLPYPNRLAVVYMTGDELVEFLASASYGFNGQNLNIQALASFMQVSGLKYEINTNVEYEKGDAYGKLWYKCLNKDERIKITSVNGLEFDRSATYGVLVNNAIANGMDSNYICITENRDKAVFDIKIVDLLAHYIENTLGGVIGESYENVEGRVIIK